MPNYDYIIIGAGVSGLLLADALGNDSFFKSKKILLLDKSEKVQNDRTWCFWEVGKGPFDDLLHKRWPNIRFAGADLEVSQNITPYTYKMLRGLDFYQHYLGKIKSYPNIYFENDEVLSLSEGNEYVTVSGNKGSYTAGLVFDSRFDYQKLKEQSEYPVLQQHFLGWFIKTKQPVFDQETATFMDFSIPQKGNTRFMYVLPFSKTEALVEYTLFSDTVLEKEEYENSIKDYLQSQLSVEKFEVLEVEHGNIPMTCFDFAEANTDRVFKVGIAGGWAKPSTGYTFYNSTKKVKKLTAYLKTGKPLSKFTRKTRFWFYDLLLLDILKNNNSLGSAIFGAMFKKRPPQLILKFLDEETSLWEDLKIIVACPKAPFIKAFFRRIFS